MVIFAFHNNKWVFVNQKLTSLKDVTEDKQIPIGSMVDITNGKKTFIFKRRWRKSCHNNNSKQLITTNKKIKLW